MFHFHLLYFGNGFEQPFWTKNLFCCYINKGGNSGSVVPQKLAVEIENKVTDGDQIVVGVQGSNEKLLASMINSLIIKRVLCGNNGKGGVGVWDLKKISELILVSVCRSFS